MKKLTEVIKQAAERMGSMQELEDYLGLPRKTLSMVGKTRGLPDYAQDKLEALMKLPGGSLRAASAIITETKPERRNYWEKKLEHGIAASMATIFVAVIFFMTPTPAQASTGAAKSFITMYIMLNYQDDYLAKFSAWPSAYYEFQGLVSRSVDFEIGRAHV